MSSELMRSKVKFQPVAKPDPPAGYRPREALRIAPGEASSQFGRRDGAWHGIVKASAQGCQPTLDGRWRGDVHDAQAWTTCALGKHKLDL